MFKFKGPYPGWYKRPNNLSLFDTIRKKKIK